MKFLKIIIKQINQIQISFNKFSDLTMEALSNVINDLEAQKHVNYFQKHFVP